MVEKIKKITDIQALLIIAVAGFVFFFSGLTSAFQGDDFLQIVNNVPVHSISNIRLFFDGGTFYNGGGLAPLTGTFYRPLMSTTFSLLYSLFGPHPLYFHLFQLLLCIGSAFLLYLFFKYSFKPTLALVLALIFLVHPLNSQVAFAIPSMQDALFFFFGILALWLLLRFTSVRSLIVVAVCLFLSLLSKESAVLFVALALLYLLWWDRRRLYWFVAIMALPVALWLVLKIHALGLLGTRPDVAAIDRLSLAGRLFTVPSMLLLFITKLVFPAKLVALYYWVYPHFSFRHFVLPLMIDLTAAALIIYTGFAIRKRGSKAQTRTFWFFAVWTVIGLIIHLQIFPLDMTVCETWFYFSTAGVLGMAGVVVTVFRFRVRQEWLLGVAVVLICSFGIRTLMRGYDWRSADVLTSQEVAESPNDYTSYNVLAQNYYNQDNFSKAQTYEERSVALFPTFINNLNLGNVLLMQGNFAGAKQAYDNGLTYGRSISIYHNLARLTMVYGKASENQQFLLGAVDRFPQDPTFWECLAIFQASHQDNADAQISISNAVQYGQIPPGIYTSIMNNQPFTVNYAGKTIAMP